MVSLDNIKEAACKIGRAADAEKVILFGSYARQQAHSASDVDFLVIAESRLPRHKRSRALYQLFKPYPFGMDILVYTPDEVEQAGRCDLSLVATALQEGQVLYVRSQ